MKKIISTLLVLVLLLCTPHVIFAEEQYTDIPASEIAVNSTPLESVIPPENEINAQDVVVYDAAWFAALRTYYLNYESHYTSNSAIDNREYIYNQTTCPNFAIGTRYMSGVGCEIAATYNALKARGYIIYTPNIIRSFEKNGYLMGVGYLGSDPYAIGDYMSTNGIEYTEFTDFTDLNYEIISNSGTEQVYIVSYWNTDDITGGLHTVMFKTTTGGSMLHVYNLNSGQGATTISINALISIVSSRSRFIVGYSVARFRARNLSNAVTGIENYEN